MFKYCVHPGYINSKNDGERHFIDASQLMRLYKVDPKECRVSLCDHRKDSFICLFPSYDGIYTLKEV